MAVSVVNQWTGHRRAAGTTSSLPKPASLPAYANISNAAGNMLIAICSWTLSPGYLGTTVTVSDDAHNFWQPVGAPTGTSSALGYTRCSIWAVPNANTASRVYVSPCGLPSPVCPAVLGVTVIEVSGMSDFLGTPAAATDYVNSGVAVSTGGLTGTPQSLLVTVAASDSTGFTLGPGASWTALTGLSVNSGSPLILYTSPAYAVATGGLTTLWSGSGDLSACTVAIPVSVSAPTAPNSHWPYTQLQAGFGAGALTPPDQVPWTDVTDRFLAGSACTVTSGKQYELDQLEAGEATPLLDNNDGALTPFEAGPFYPDVVADVPVRLLMTWNSQAYCVFSNFVERWPSAWQSGTWYGVSQVTVVDAWSLQNNELDSNIRQETGMSGPYAYWTLSDVAGTLAAQNSAPGNTTAMVVASSPTGTAGTNAFGQTVSSNLPGDPGGTVWSQTGLAFPADEEQGSCLIASDVNYPTLTGGVTLSGWFTLVPGQATDTVLNAVLLRAGNAAGPYFSLELDSGQLGTPTTGTLELNVRDLNGAVTTEYGSQANWYQAGWFNVAVTLQTTSSTLTYAVYANGAAWKSGTVSGSWPSTFQWVESIGAADRYSRTYNTGFWNGAAAHIAVFPGVLTEDRIASLYFAGTPNPQTIAGGTSQTVSGQQFAGENAQQRIERLLAYGGWTGPRSISANTSTPMAAISDIQGTATAISSTGVVTAAQGEQVNQAVNGIVLSDGGFIFVDGNGVLCYVSRQDLYNATPKWTLGEDVANGEIPYEPTARIGYDKSLLYNSAQLTQSAGTGTPVVSTNVPSIAAHGEYVYNATVYQQDINQVGDLANWISFTRGEVALRGESITVDAASNPSNWPFVLSICPATVVRINRRPQLGGAEISVLAIVAQVRKTIDFAAGVAKVDLVTDSFPEGAVLALDDVDNGLLDGTHPLGW